MYLAHSSHHPAAAMDTGHRKLTRRVLACATALLIAVVLALGGTAAGVDGPGVPKQTFTANDVFLDNNVRELARIAVPPASNGAPGFGHGRGSIIGGYLFVPFFTEDRASGGGFDLYRLTTGSGGTIPATASANAPTLTPAFRRNRPASGPTIREAHAYGLAWVNGKRLLVMQATNGIEIWDFTTPLVPILVRNFSVSGLNGDGDTSNYSGSWWVSLQWPYAYIGGNGSGLRIVDLSDPANPVLRTSMPTSNLGGFTVGSVHAVGNLLVVASNSSSNADASDLGGGYSLWDISNPIAPANLKTYTQANTWPRGYSSMLNGNRLIIGGTNESFQMIDISDPLAIVRFPVLNGPGPGGYINFQDGFAFSGYQTHAIKVNTTVANATTAPVLVRRGTIDVVARDSGDLNFAMPLGNMLFAANDRLGKGSALLVHDAAADNTGPVVNMVNPKNGATNQGLTSRVGLTFTDELADQTLTTANITLRRQGTTQAIAGTLSYQMNMVNFTPAAPLLAGTTYEVFVRPNGVTDVSGNPSASSFTSTFTTAGVVVTPPVSAVIAKPTPRTLSTAASFTVTSATGQAPLQYAWNFGNGVTTAFSASSSASHTYSRPGHYSVSATVRDSTGATATSQLEIQVVYVAPTATAPSSSGSLGLLPALNRLYSVNPDADTVAVIDTNTNTKVGEIAVGRHPRALAVRTADNTVWVANQDSATVSVINASTNTVMATIAMPRASQPCGIAVAPNQAAVYVSLTATGQLAKLDPTTRTLVGTPLAVGPTPRAVAVNHDSTRVLVTRFISSDTQGEVVDVNATTMTVTRTIALPADTTTVDDERQARGVANYLAGVTISPDGTVAWVPSKKDNILRGTNRDGKTLNFQNTVRAIVSHVSLASGTGAQLLDINDSDAPSAVAFTPRGDQAFVATQGTNTVHLVNVYDNSTRLFPVGMAPQGLTVNAAGTRLYVHNFMARTVGVYDISGITNFTNGQATLLSTIATVTREKLTPSVLAGKRIFYDASTRRMNSDGYISCASCHFDGGQDGRVWDFTERGEGFRRTTDLRGRSGVGHGPVHWTGNFDEIHDFEHDIRGGFGGSGFMSNADFNTGTRNTTLGLAKAGVSLELDQLAAYLSSLSTAPVSPLRNQDGSLTAAAVRGQAVFIQHGCATCHSGPRLTDSALNRFHDVGTATQPTSGKRLNGTLTGFDTPTLKGLWSAGRYLHDGSQTTLAGVFQADDPTPGLATHKVVTTLSAGDRADLFAYMLQIDDAETPAYVPTGADNLVVIEAEAFSALQAPVGQAHSWVPVINGTAFANTIALHALPNSGAQVAANLNAASPRADYLVQFPAASTYTIWVRGQGATTADNSAFVGVNGQAPATVTGVTLPVVNGWVKYPDTITVAGGRQTINLWMREDGVVIDRILLTTNAALPAPSGVGPNESKTTLSGTGSPIATAPVITTQPTNVAVNAGQSATFSVVASGTGPLTYVWKRGTTIVGGNTATLSLTNVQTADAGTYTCTVSNSAGTATSNAATLTVNVVVPDSFQQDSGADGLVVIEAESALGNRSAVGGKSWQTVTTPTGFSGSGALQALSNTGAKIELANLVNSPRVDYPITFTKTGVHYVWVRGLGATTEDNSVTIGIDGVPTTTSESLSLPTTFAWNNTNATPPAAGAVRTLTVGSIGVHTLNLWMREDGAVVDKLLLTVTPSQIPSGNGPAESPLAGTTPPPPVLPAPWVTSVIGNATPAGSASAVNDVFTISGSGADIWGTMDAFRAVSQPVTGDCDLIARVDSLENTNVWAKAGVMLRSSLQANAAHAMTVVTPGNGVSFQNRITAGAASNFTNGPSVRAPYWVRISRRGNVFAGYSSANGTTWNLVSNQTISMPAGIHACLVVTSHQPGVVCTAVISQMSVVPVASN